MQTTRPNDKLHPSYANSVTAMSWPCGQKREWETTTAKCAGFIKDLNCISLGNKARALGGSGWPQGQLIAVTESA